MRKSTSYPRHCHSLPAGSKVSLPVTFISGISILMYDVICRAGNHSLDKALARTLGYQS